ncbi:MAG: 4-alpha-glucanotransferase [Actinomycetaceae bacterium]|nr:4-alpha-glucanotransferase [Actinomycetaceae bacterium]
MSTGSQEIPQISVDPQELRNLAHRCAIDTEYWDWGGQHHDVSASSLLAILRAFDFDITDQDSIGEAHKELDERPWRSVLPPCLVVRQGVSVQFPVHVPHGTSLHVHVECEDGSTRDLQQVDVWVDPRHVDGQLIGRATFEVPHDLPIGWHTLVAVLQDGSRVSSPLALAPDRLHFPDLARGRGWGMMLQFYSVCSKESWGMGDFKDLADTSAIFARLGADFVLTNPIHAPEPSVPLTPSPYLPCSRIFTNPLYIRPEDIEEFAYLEEADKSACQDLFTRAATPTARRVEKQLIDRDRSWENKKKALEIIFKHPRSDERQAQFEDFIKTLGRPLWLFALWSVIGELYPDIEDWPERYRTVNSPAVEDIACDYPDRVKFYMWLQWVVDSQLANVQEVAKNNGMAIGLMNDLAVGIHPYGADIWSLPEAFALGVSVGAPPDMYNQHGQNWSQPPLRPDYLERSAYAPLRAIVRAALKHSGALRIDHIMAMFRLWWIPKGAGAQEGAYVRYNHEAMVGVLLLEAYRQGAVIIGEDLGTVEPWVRDYLAERGILGTSVIWFEKDWEGHLLPPNHYRSSVLATVNTHDLPPTAGYLAGEHIDVQEELGLLVQPVEELRAAALAERQDVIRALHSWGLVDDHNDVNDEELVIELHKYVCLSPAKLLGAALVDAVGDRRMQNQPGTDRERPNWKVPLSDATGQRVFVEDLEESPGLKQIAEAMNQGLQQTQ